MNIDWDTKLATKRERVGIEMTLNKVRPKPSTRSMILQSCGSAKTSAEHAATELFNKEKSLISAQKTEVSMREALATVGMDVFAVANKIKSLTDHEDYRAVSNGVDFALKVGVGGGYAPTRSQNIDVRVAGDVNDFAKFKALTDEYDERLARQSLEEGG